VQEGAREEVRDRRDAGTGAREADQQLGGVGGRSSRRNAFPPLLAAGQRPRHRRTVGAEQADRVVRRELLRRRRLTPLRQVVGRGIQAVGKRSQAARGEQRIVWQRPDADGGIESLAQQVDPARREVQLQRDGRVQGHERGQHVAEHQVRDVAGHGYPQPPARRGLAVVAQGRRGVHLEGDLARVLEKLPSELGQRLTPRRAQQEALANPRLQRRDAPRDGGLWQTQPLGGAAEAPQLGDAGEHEQVAWIDARRCLFHL